VSETLSPGERVAMVEEAPHGDEIGAERAHTDCGSGGRTWRDVDMTSLLVVAQAGREVEELKVARESRAEPLRGPGAKVCDRVMGNLSLTAARWSAVGPCQTRRPTTYLKLLEMV
jgi:hypothetical protein